MPPKQHTEFILISVNKKNSEPEKTDSEFF